MKVLVTDSDLSIVDQTTAASKFLCSQCLKSKSTTIGLK